eukprot:CAMPEP_0198299158 /NCGR_PEP_ID=MMETSP1449-20131203/43689_1 /TAXON_ID=420275 /ORGANISM="Attheya septentrionalis, Strain CCMP2084" /LENGTH=44 /DNA_ID= /DNA_START= /DNA_END= /DNA_ORIENTATION=
MVGKSELAKGASSEETEHKNDDVRPQIFNLMFVVKLQSSVRSCM